MTSTQPLLSCSHDLILAVASFLRIRLNCGCLCLGCGRLVSLRVSTCSSSESVVKESIIGESTVMITQSQSNTAEIFLMTPRAIVKQDKLCEGKQMVTKIFCDKGVSQGSEQDRISQLPNDLRCHILSFLSTKEAIRASVLSTKWRNLWQLVLGLDLDARDFGHIDDFVIFVDKFFNFHRESWIHKLLLKFYAVGSVDYTSYLTTWIDAATTRRVQHIDLNCEYYDKVAVDIPLRLYTSETLVHLRLARANLVSAEFVSLPCLKILCLEYVKLSDGSTLEKLISHSPVLEDLTIVYFKRYCKGYYYTSTLSDTDQESQHQSVFQSDLLVIDAPVLQYLRILSYSIKNIKIINLGFTAKVAIKAHWLRANGLSSRSIIHDFITSISRVRWLIIDFDTTKDIFHYMKSEPMRQFCYLSRLSADFSLSNLEMLPNLLKSCPKLESLNLKFVDYEKIKKAEVMSWTVPPCLVSSLKFVRLIYVLYGCGTELKVARYFLKNSTIMERLSLRKDYKKENVKHIVQELQAIPRCSSTCEVVLLL